LFNHHSALLSHALRVQVKAPQITHFEVPFQIWTTSSLLLFLIYTTSVPQHSTSNFWRLARILRYDTFPDAVFPAVWAFVCIVHVAEGAYAATLARKHNMPCLIAVRPAFFCVAVILSLDSESVVSQTAWVSFATIFGMPVLIRLRHLIKQARIESIMKGH
jgi:hypothetical protein